MNHQSPPRHDSGQAITNHIVIDGRFWRRSAAGLSTYTRHLVSELATIDKKNRYTILITPADKAELDLQSLNVRTEIVDIGHYTLAEQIRLPAVLKRLKPDLVHFLHFNHPLTYRGPFVVTLHDLTVVYHPVGRQQQNPLRRWAFLATMRHAARAAKRVIAVSQATKRDIVRDLGGKQDTIDVVYEGMSDVVSIPPKSIAALKPLGVTPPYLLFVSQWRPHKGIVDLVTAFEKIAADFPKLTLVIAGKPNPAFPEIFERVERSPVRDRIVTPGFIPDELLSTLYTHAELFVIPSHYEGFGLPPLEAMSLGTPVLASDSSSLPEILGEAAAYFPTGNVPALADRLRTLLGDEKERQRLSAAGPRHAAHFSWQRAAKETLEIYRRVLSAR